MERREVMMVMVMVMVSSLCHALALTTTAKTTSSAEPLQFRKRDAVTGLKHVSRVVVAVMNEERSSLVSAASTSAEKSASTEEETDGSKTLIRVAAETWQPYFLIRQGEAGDTQYSGIMWDLLLMLADKMNVRVQLVRPPDGLWGVELPNGSWNGMLGMVQRQEVDMAVGPFAISYPRTKVADFPASIFVLPHRVYLPRPRGTSDPSDFVRLFHPTVWALMLACVGVVAVVVWVAARVEDSFILAPHEANKNYVSLSYVFLYVWGGLIQESWLWRGPGVSRWVMGLWLLATLVLMSTYSGLLVASLTLPRVPVPIASVQQLVDQDNLPWKLEQGGIILHTFETASVKLYKTLLQCSGGFFPDCYAARMDIAQGKFAGLCDTLAGDLMVAKSFSESGKCEFFSPQENVVTHSYTMVMQKASPYRNLINFWLQELQERGWVDQLVRQRVNNGTVCRLPPGKEEGQRPPKPLTLMQLWGVFGTLGVGAAGAAVVFLMEVKGRQQCFVVLLLPQDPH